MKCKTVDDYDQKIETLKVAIKRLRAEKRVAILRQRERKHLAELTSKQGDNNDR